MFFDMEGDPLFDGGLEYLRNELTFPGDGIPLVLLPLEQQQRFVDAVEAVAPGRGFLLYTYCITSPLPYRKLRLTARREAWTPLNFPPASVWRWVKPLSGASRRSAWRALTSTW